MFESRPGDMHPPDRRLGNDRPLLRRGNRLGFPAEYYLRCKTFRIHVNTRIAEDLGTGAARLDRIEVERAAVINDQDPRIHVTCRR